MKYKIVIFTLCIIIVIQFFKLNSRVAKIQNDLYKTNELLQLTNIIIEGNLEVDFLLDNLDRNKFSVNENEHLIVLAFKENASLKMVDFYGFELIVNERKVISTNFYKF